MISETAIMDPERAAQAKSEPTDLVLMRAREGDAAAFETLLRRHERLVFGTAWQCLGGHPGIISDVEDAAQEVFLRLHQHLARLDPSRSLAAWLYRVTINVCRTFGRKRRGRPTVSLDDEVEPLRAAGMDPASAAELVEERKMVTEGLATLSRKERSALVLHDLEGLSTREVANALDVTEVTVRTHLCRARCKMRTFRERWLRRKP